MSYVEIDYYDCVGTVALLSDCRFYMLIFFDIQQAVGNFCPKFSFRSLPVQKFVKILCVLLLCTWVKVHIEAMLSSQN